MSEPDRLYIIVRRYYRDAKRLSDGDYYDEYDHGFDPMTLREAEIMKRKLCPRTRPRSIEVDHIVYAKDTTE